MHMNKRLRRYFRLQYRHGKSILAFALDKIAAITGVLLVSFIFIWSMGANIRWSAIFALCAAAVFAVVDYAVYKSRLKKLVESMLNEARRELALERLIMDENAEKSIICDIVKEDGGGKFIEDGALTSAGIYYIKLYHPLCEFSAEDALKAIRAYKSAGSRKLTVVTTAKMTVQAASLLSRNGGEIDKTIIENAKDKYMPDEDELEEYLLIKYDEQRTKAESVKRSFADKSKAKSWMSCAAMLVIWGIVFGKGALFYTAAGICAALSGYCLMTKANH